MALGWALSACPDAEPRLQPVPEGALVLAFGDSLTRGSGAPAGSSYPEQLAARIHRTVVNAGIPGELSAAGLARLPGVLETHRPRLVVLCHGGNDLLRGAEEAALERNVAMMVELCRGAGAQVVLLGVPRPDVWLRPPELFAEVAAEHRVPYDGELLPRILGDPRLKADPIHPNAAGYRVLAAGLHALLVERGALP